MSQSDWLDTRRDGDQWGLCNPPSTPSWPPPCWSCCTPGLGDPSSIYLLSSRAWAGSLLLATSLKWNVQAALFLLQPRCHSEELEVLSLFFLPHSDFQDPALLQLPPNPTPYLGSFLVQIGSSFSRMCACCSQRVSLHVLGGQRRACLLETPESSMAIRNIGFGNKEMNLGSPSLINHLSNNPVCIFWFLSWYHGL